MKHLLPPSRKSKIRPFGAVDAAVMAYRSGKYSTGLKKWIGLIRWYAWERWNYQPMTEMEGWKHCHAAELRRRDIEKHYAHRFLRYHLSAAVDLAHLVRGNDSKIDHILEQLAKNGFSHNADSPIRFPSIPEEYKNNDTL